MSLNKTLLKNGTLYLNNEFINQDILIEDGIIKIIAENIKDDEAQLIDCTNKLITPSFVDVHVHLRTPGFEYKEDLITGSKAALKGGYSHLCSMPNTSPCLDEYNIIKEHLQDINEKALCHVYPFSAMSYSLGGKELVEIEKIATL